jgi:hypothetical protein
MIPLRELDVIWDALADRTGAHGWQLLWPERADENGRPLRWVLGRAGHEPPEERVELSFLIDPLDTGQIWAVRARRYHEDESRFSRLHELALLELGSSWRSSLETFLTGLHAALADSSSAPASPTFEAQWTAARWWSCTDLRQLMRAVQHRLSPRKAQLIACAFCRHVWRSGKDRRGRRALEAAELHADGLVSAAYLWSAAAEARGLPALVARDVRGALALAARHAEPQELCDLVREVLGDPLHPPVCDPAWLRWSDGCVEKMVRTIFRGQRFAELPILADALEEAGCDNAAMLAHCRQARPHARGCWVVDALLART